jgi:hypothetical protein
MWCFRSLIVLLALISFANAAENDKASKPKGGSGPICCTDATKPLTPASEIDKTPPPTGGGGPKCCSDADVADVLGMLRRQKSVLQKNENEVDQYIQRFEQHVK